MFIIHISSLLSLHKIFVYEINDDNKFIIFVTNVCTDILIRKESKATLRKKERNSYFYIFKDDIN